MRWTERPIAWELESVRITFLRSTAMVVLTAVGCIGIACSGNQASPTAATTLPAPPIAPQPAPPVPTTFALTGRVTEAPPTTTTEVPHAVVTITDGVNAGRSVIANVFGFYSIPDLAVGAVTVKVSADSFVSTTARLDMNVAGETTRNFQLMPVPKTLSYTLHGDLRGADGTCSDGESMKPCRITVMPIHNEGMIEVTLNWEPGGAADLDLTLFETGSTVPIARSAGPGNGQKRVSARVSGGHTYEFRMTYASGKEDVKYTLTFSCPS
jgi:hypothetical protein